MPVPLLGKSTVRGVAGCLLPLLLLPAVGCGGIGNMSGKVTYKGKPVIFGTVMVIAKDNLPYYGQLDEEGNYTITKIPSGAVKVAVNSPDPRTPIPRKPGQNEVDQGNKGGGGRRGVVADPSFKPPVDPKKWFPLPEKYGDPETSGVTLEIHNGENAFNIDLP
jgi:hypothetical protein